MNRDNGVLPPDRAGIRVKEVKVKGQATKVPNVVALLPVHENKNKWCTNVVFSSIVMSQEERSRARLQA